MQGTRRQGKASRKGQSFKGLAIFIQNVLSREPARKCSCDQRSFPISYLVKCQKSCVMSYVKVLKMSIVKCLNVKSKY